MPIKIKCPACQAKLNIADRKAGLKISCPTCDAVFRVPKKKLTPKKKTTKQKQEQPEAIDELENEQEFDSVVNEMTSEERSVAPTADFDIFEPEDEEIEAPEYETSREELLDDLFEEEDFKVAEANEESQPIKEPEPEVEVSSEAQEADVASDAEKGVDEVDEPIIESLEKERDEQRGITELKLAEALARKQKKRTSHSKKRRQDEYEDDEDGFQLRPSSSEFDEMDLTPMVDVTFLLLVFFMITASFSLQKSLEVPPPDPNEKGAASAPSLEDLEKESIMVEIDEEDQIIVDDEPLTDRSELISRLEDVKREDNLKREIIINANTKSRNETLVYVIDAANDVKMQRIRLASSGDDSEQ